MLDAGPLLPAGLLSWQFTILHSCFCALPLQAIERRIADTSRYKHVIFLNSSVRGPFLPAYWPVRCCWGLIAAVVWLYGRCGTAVPGSGRCWVATRWPLEGWAASQPAAPPLHAHCRCAALPQSPQADRHWSRVLTDRINNDVKLVGATIRCGFCLLEQSCPGGPTICDGKGMPLAHTLLPFVECLLHLQLLPAAAARVPTRAVC